MLTMLLDAGELSAVIIVGLLLFFGLLVVVVILLKKRFSSLQIKKDEKMSEADVARQELDRILVPVKDEKIRQAMDEEARKSTAHDEKGAPKK